MSRQLHKLAATQVKNPTRSKTITKMGDGGGLTLVIKNTTKLWWFRYKYDGKAKTLSLGQYDHASLPVTRTLSEGIIRIESPRSHREFVSRTQFEYEIHWKSPAVDV